MKVKSVEEEEDVPLSLHTQLKVGIELILEKMDKERIPLAQMHLKKLLMINNYIWSTGFLAYLDIP